MSTNDRLKRLIDFEDKLNLTHLTPAVKIAMKLDDQSAVEGLHVCRASVQASLVQNRRHFILYSSHPRAVLDT